MREFAEPGRQERQLLAVERQFGDRPVVGPHRFLAQLKDELADYFAKRLRAFTVPIVHPGTAFQQQLWAALLAIPYGEFRSYDEIALAVGNPKACRAVGTANGSNRIAIVIPCHRVLNKGGTLGGYGGGLWRKERLLQLEESLMI